ncbi:hypothetical protein [Leifsonia aquatica]|uniref:hypothetical protein n=1 Tax=Leifsonia aquatica TaxID=144185 RepID=UPI0004684391|nr:hypothetical protein [Leifsonia aquatica]
MKSTQGHRKRHEASASHRRLAALDYGAPVPPAVKQSDQDFADFIALFRPQRLTGYELELYLRAKTPDHFEMEAA